MRRCPRKAARPCCAPVERQAGSPGAADGELQFLHFPEGKAAVLKTVFVLGYLIKV